MLLLLQIFRLQNVVSLDRCRLVKYDEYYESLERSFEGDEVGHFTQLYLLLLAKCVCLVAVIGCSHV